MNAPYALATQALEAGLADDPSTRAIAPNIVMSVNHAFAPGSGAFSTEGIADLTRPPFLYASWCNPTVRQLEQRIAALEGAEDALASATGMAAMAAIFFSLLEAGDHLIVSDVCYAGVNELARRVLPRLGIEVSAVNLTRLDAVRAALRPNTRLIHAESPCNPLLRLTDLRSLATLAHGHGALVSVDSTLATPLATQPLALGVDLVMHSMTKFLNGHGDALGGCVAGSRALIGRLRERAGVYLGAALPAHSAWLIMRGIDSLVPRLRMACASAQRIAEYLQAHPRVRRVTYPGLPSHPQHALAQRQMKLPGALIVFQVAAPDALIERMARELRLIDHAFSLGHQRSLIVLLKTAELLASSYALDAEQLADYRRWAGDGLLRLSVGLEDPQDLIDDLDRVLSP